MHESVLGGVRVSCDGRAVRVRKVRDAERHPLVGVIRYGTFFSVG